MILILIASVFFFWAEYGYNPIFEQNRVIQLDFSRLKILSEFPLIFD
jgi:hypothetical protein